MIPNRFAQGKAIFIGAVLLMLTTSVHALGDTLQLIAVQDFDQFNDALPGSFDPSTDNLDGGGGDFWGVGSRNAWPQGFPTPGVPFGIADDTVFGYSNGTQFEFDDEGIFGVNSDLSNNYFAISDSDFFGAGQTATWQFDISGYSNLSISIDIGSDIDADFPYDPGSFVKFVGQIDSGSNQTLFDFTPAGNPLAPGTLRSLDGGSNEDAQNLLFASGDATITKTFAEGPTSTVAGDLYLDKSRVVNGALDSFATDISGTGATLTITITADMPFEAVVFDNIRVFGEPDCNTNGVSDSDDISAGTSADCNANDVPDECELVGNDCNANSVPDECDSNPEFSNQVIITSLADGARSVVASDLDGDGDLDVLSVSNNNNAVEWYENIDGFGLFGAPNTVSAPTESASSAIAADLDDDGDQDVLLASFSDSTIAWYQNTDGHGSFGGRQVISSIAWGPLHVIAVDLDGDTDKDVVYAGNTGFNIATKIEWFENLDGMGTFGPRNLIFSENSYESRSLHAADLDGDGDSDILAPGAQADRVDWFENTDGNGNFGPPRTITTLTDFAASAVAADIDGDGDLDVFSGSALDDKVAWYENTNGLGSFGPQRVISTTGSNPSSLVAVDLDHDGDIDVAVADFGNDSIGWYENIDGLGTFGTLNLISNDSDLSFGADIAAADLDGNNRVDVLSASITDDTIAWYPNTQLSIDCNGNGVLDECDIDGGTSSDCNTNGVPDACDLAGGFSDDCNTNGIPDECDLEGQATELGKLTAADATPGKDFGSQVSLSGDTAVIGADLDDENGSDSGSAYVFREVAGEWQQIAKLTAADAAASDYFGISVALSGDTAVIGAWRDDDGGDSSGSAYVFREVAGVWQQIAKLTAADAAAGDEFGRRVALSGDTAVIGAIRDDDGGTWSGSAYVFREVAGVWQQIAKLTAADAAEFDQFGEGVALSGDTAVIGAIGDDDGGSAYVFREVAGVWQQIAKLTAADAAAFDFFGISISLSGDTAVIGASENDAGGSAYVFREVAGIWQQIAKLTGAAGDNFGYRVALNGDTVVIGASLNNDNDGGSAYVFREVAGVWQQIAKLTAADAAAGDAFGTSAALSGDIAVIGARLDDDGGSDSGSAYVFDVSLSPTSLDLNNNGIPDECEIVVGDLNCNGDLSITDIEAFVLALTDPAGYAAQYPLCDPINGDCDSNAILNGSDISCFVGLLTEP